MLFSDSTEHLRSKCVEMAVWETEPACPGDHFLIQLTLGMLN